MSQSVSLSAKSCGHDVGHQGHEPCLRIRTGCATMLELDSSWHGGGSGINGGTSISRGIGSSHVDSFFVVSNA